MLIQAVTQYQAEESWHICHLWFHLCHQLPEPVQNSIRMKTYLIMQSFIGFNSHFLLHCTKYLNFLNQMFITVHFQLVTGPVAKISVVDDGQ